MQRFGRYLRYIGLVCLLGFVFRFFLQISPTLVEIWKAHDWAFIWYDWVLVGLGVGFLIVGFVIYYPVYLYGPDYPYDGPT